MSVNSTQILNDQASLQAAHTATAIPAMIILFSVIMLVLFIGVFVLSPKSDKLKALMALVFVVGLGTLIALSMMPNAVQFLVALFPF